MKGRVVILSALVGAVLFAHEDHKGKPVTIIGTVVDTGCYLSHDAIGEKHIDCATTCAKAGIPLAVVDASGKLYLPIAADHKNPNVRLMPFIEKKVKVTGTALDKGGLSGIAIKTIEAAP
jgi:hypothetical protein